MDSAITDELARCHERLGLTHCFEMIDGKFVRREIQMEKRVEYPDEIFRAQVREHLLTEDRDECAAERDRLFEAAKAVVLTMRKVRNGTLVDSGPIVALAELVLEMAEPDEDEDDNDA